MGPRVRLLPSATARIKALCRLHGGQSEVAARVGVAIATFQRILAGRADIDDERLEALARVLDTTVDVLVGEEAAAGSVVHVGIFDVEVAAGAGRVSLEPEDAVGFWPLPRDWVERHFGTGADLRIARVAGDSQEPELRDGDLVVFDLAQTRLRDGMHVVRLGDTLLLKRVQVEGARVRLKSRNPDYDDIIVDIVAERDAFQVIGRAGGAVKLL